MTLDDAQKLADTLMAEHGLTARGWRFEFDKASKRFGFCLWSLKVISLSRNLTLANDEVHVRDTILHEIAHALVGHGHGHGPVWQAKAREIGATPSAYYDSNKVTPHAPWWLECWRCQRRYPKAKRTRISYSCAKCSLEVTGKRYSPQFILKWVPNEEQLSFSRRPQSGVTKQVWDIADELTKALGRIPDRMVIIRECILRGVNPATAQVQYSKWFRFQSEESR